MSEDYLTEVANRRIDFANRVMMKFNGQPIMEIQYWSFEHWKHLRNEYKSKVDSDVIIRVLNALHSSIEKLIQDTPNVIALTSTCQFIREYKENELRTKD